MLNAKSMVKGCIRAFSKGEVVINHKVGILSYVTQDSPKGKCNFSGKVLQGKPLRVSEHARTHELNKAYFRRATKKEMKIIEKRFSF